jgi:hypothetical protein
MVPRVVIGAEPQILIDAGRVDYFPGVHFPIRIPQRLEFAERLYQFRAVYLVQELGLGLPIAMF